MNITKPDTTTFLLPEGSEEVTYAKEQGHLGYAPLPVIRTPRGKLASQWMPTPGELALLNEGVPVTLVVWTFGDPPQPVSLMVGGADLR
jgi:hypothetical protein